MEFHCIKTAELSCKVQDPNGILVSIFLRIDNVLLKSLTQITYLTYTDGKPMKKVFLTGKLTHLFWYSMRQRRVYCSCLALHFKWHKLLLINHSIFNSEPNLDPKIGGTYRASPSLMIQYFPSSKI